MLLVFQALDAAGKDSTIRHVFAGVNPCGLHVASFKEPSRRELAHDFLWRTTAQLPERGSVAIFNRSYYEEVLVVRVHPEFLAAQKLPETPSKTFWDDRLRAIADYERHLAEQGTVILKFWLNVSKAEQRKQLLERIDESEKKWKFNARDLDERALWDEVSRRVRRSAYVRRRGRGRRGMPCRPTTSTTCVGKSQRSSTRRSMSSASISGPWTRRRSALLKKAKARLTGRERLSASVLPLSPREPLLELLELRRRAREQLRREARARADERAEDLVGGEHVQAFAREILQPQVAIRVARGTLEPRRQRLGVRGVTCS